MGNKQVSFHSLIDMIAEKIDNDGEVFLTVTGNSMNPFMVDKLTQVTLVKPRISLKKYDIVLYKSYNQWVLHRIIRIKGNVLIICGDALKKYEYIDKQEVVAFVSKIYNHNRIVDVNSFFYKLKVRLWVFLKPIRRYLLAIFRRIRKKN